MQKLSFTELQGLLQIIIKAKFTNKSVTDDTSVPWAGCAYTRLFCHVCQWFFHSLITSSVIILYFLRYLGEIIIYATQSSRKSGIIVILFNCHRIWLLKRWWSEAAPVWGENPKYFIIIIIIRYTFNCMMQHHFHTTVVRIIIIRLRWG
jgi:hypothetical protein